MRSIRLSLVLSFLGLLGVALGGASLLVYRSAQRTLAEKRQASRKLIQARYEKDEQQTRHRLDDALLAQAQGLAQRVQIQLHWGRLRNRHLHGLGMLGRPASPNGYFESVLWFVQGWLGPVAWDMYRRNMAEIQLPRSPVLLPEASKVRQYYQIDSNYWGRPLRSPSLGTLSFPDPQEFAAGKPLDWDFQDIDLTSNRPVRLVRLKAVSAKWVSVGWRSPRSNRPRSARLSAARGVLLGGVGAAALETAEGRSRLFRPRGPRWQEPLLAIVVQCAFDARVREVALQELAASRDEELAEVDAQTEAALLGQRNRLLGISSVTFVVAALVAFWLVSLGLLPLRRLGEAVSRVSPRDFRLPLDETRLPSELRPIAQRLATTLDLLKRAFAREKQATADISHELRTPLAALLTTTELALRKPRSAEHYRELLQDCRLSAQQMNQIIERLLTLARLDAGVDLLRPQTVDVGALAEQCAAVVRPLAEASGVTLEVQHRSDSRLSTDPDKLREVLTNLLHNAIQYNRPHGSVQLRVGRENGHLEVAIQDTGIGIAPEARELIFERFYRADPSRGTDDLHAGLGLAIVKEYVDLMGGKIAVESTQGQGSTFRVQLPASLAN
jgi:heavy metal sensor kinase